MRFLWLWLSLRERAEQIPALESNTPEVVGVLHETVGTRWFRNERSIRQDRSEVGMSEREKLIELINKGEQ